MEAITEPLPRFDRQGGVLTLLRVATVAMLVAGCSFLGSPGAGVAGRTFLSTAVTDGGAPRDLVAGTRIRLSFDKAGQIGASAGCNSFGGTYRVDGGVLRINGGFMTDMGCDPERSAQDDWLFAFLGSGPSVSLTGNVLGLTAGTVALRFLDREIAEPDLPLVGPTWTVASIVAGDAVSSIPAGVVATLVFGADGHVAVQTGCNFGGGTYAINGTQLRFSDLVMTKRACEGAAGAMEASVIAVLRSDQVQFRIDASSLSLRTATGGLDLQGA